MGGLHSGVTAATTEILLESAYFTPQGIRRTSRRTALASDSSYRFERGVDPLGVLPASALAVKLILETAGGTAAQTVAGRRRAACSHRARRTRRHQTRPIDGRLDHPQRRRGNPHPARPNGTRRWPWEVPSFRADLQRHIDLVEEIARVHGLANVPSRFRGTFVPASAVDAAYDADMVLRRRLAALGLHECQTIKLIADSPTHRCAAAAPAAGGRCDPRQTAAQRGPRRDAPEPGAGACRLGGEKHPPPGQVPALLRAGPRVPQRRRRQGHRSGKRIAGHPALRRHHARGLEPSRARRRPLRSQGPDRRAGAGQNHPLRATRARRLRARLRHQGRRPEHRRVRPPVARPRARTRFHRAGLCRRARSHQTAQAAHRHRATSRTCRSSPAPRATRRWRCPPRCPTPKSKSC